MRGERLRAVGFGLAVHVVRFGIIYLGSSLAPLIGFAGWYSGLFVNVLCAAFAIALITYFRLWRRSGFVTLWRGPVALAFLALPALEATFRILPTGLNDRSPGFALWGLSLLLVGLNEELVSRVVVLDRMSQSFAALPAVAITAALFGLQHLSAFATSNRDAADILTNVVASACYGFALAAFQYRFAWVWPLVLIHACADFTTILTATPDTGDVLAIVTSGAFVIYGLWVLWPRISGRTLSPRPLRVPAPRAPGYPRQGRARRPVG